MNSFDRQIKMLIEEEVEVPESISPENIALMLKATTAKKDNMRRSEKISVKSKNRAIAIRSAAAVAACAALALGVTAFVNDTDTPEITPDVTQSNKASDYHDVYSVIQDTIINNPSDEGFAEIGNTKETDTADSVTTITSPDAERYSIPSLNVQGVDTADIIKTDGTNLYCISNNSFYIISADSGNMEPLTKIYDDAKTPVDLYVDGNKVIVISYSTIEVPYEKAEATATAEESGIAETTTSAEPEIPQTVKQNNTIVDVYDLTNKVSPSLAYSYKQNGAYISSRMVGSSLYLVTNYSNFRTKPLDSETDLDNYIPSYYLNDAKCYINAEDIILSSAADSSYTIVAGINVNESSPLVSIKALLSNCKGVYCSENAIYTIGVSGQTTTFTKFIANSGSLTFSGSNSADGVYAGSSSVTEVDGSLRAALITETSDGKSVSLHQFDQNMNSFASLGNICAGQTIEIIRFNGSDVYIITAESETPVKYSFGSEITQSVSAESDKDFVYLTNLDANYAIQIAQIDGEDGKKIRLTSFATNDGINYSEISSVEVEGEISPNFSSRSLYIDAEESIIGLPAISSDTYGNRNIYYVFTFDAANGLSEKGSVVYTDVNPSYEFSRAFRIGETLYISSEGRIVSTQISDLKVIGTLELK